MIFISLQLTFYTFFWFGPDAFRPMLSTKFKNLLSGITGTTQTPTVHRPGDDPRKECEECGNARGSNVRYYPT
jgi:hypothetical protein